VKFCSIHDRPCGKRLLITAQAAADDNDSSTELEFQNPAAPFSAELLLAVSRLGHLERYREEIKMVYQPGDYTRQAISLLAMSLPFVVTSRLKHYRQTLMHNLYPPIQYSCLTMVQGPQNLQQNLPGRKTRFSHSALTAPVPASATLCLDRHALAWVLCCGGFAAVEIFGTPLLIHRIKFAGSFSACKR
jgi:hypothetical protein